MTILEELEQAAGAVAGRVGAATVRIGRDWGRGSGVVIGDGLVLTNAHNLRGAETTVTFGDDRKATGRVQGVDVDGDLAVLAVDTAGAEPVEWADGSAAQVGTPVFAVANPGGGRGVRVTFGLTSAVGREFRGPRGRRITGSIEHTAPLTRGSSGGPLVDGAGRLLGLNTNRLGDGFYLAIPAGSELRSRVDALARGDSPSRRHLGLALAPSRVARQMRRAVGLPERDGLLVRQVEQGSPAANSGLRPGDLVVGAQGRDLAGADDLYDVLDGLDDGESLALSVIRGTDDLAVSVTFGATREEGSA